MDYLKQWQEVTDLIQEWWQEFTEPSLNSLIGEKQWGAVIERLIKKPAESQEVVLFGLLPLHMACWEQAPLEVIDALMIAHPAALEAKDQLFGFLPLHFLFYYNGLPSVDIVSRMIRAHPAAARTADDDGNLPLHIACARRGMSEDLLKALIIANPEGLFARNKDGETPMQLASNDSLQAIFTSLNLSTASQIKELKKSKLQVLKTAIRNDDGKTAELQVLATSNQHLKTNEDRLMDQVNDLKRVVANLREDFLTQQHQNEAILLLVTAILIFLTSKFMFSRLKANRHKAD